MQNLWKSLHGVKQIKKKLYWKTKFSENHHCIAYVAQQALHELQLQNKYGPFLSYFKIDFNFNLTVENQQSKKIKERTGLFKWILWSCHNVETLKFWFPLKFFKVLYFISLWYQISRSNVPAFIQMLFVLSHVLWWSLIILI